MKYVGVDACRKGWFAVCLSPNYRWDIEIFTAIGDLWNRFQSAALLLIDIPIGLPESGKRKCDIDARKILKQRATSVFPAPCRQAIHANSYPEACRINKKILGVKLSVQTWNISGKIREADDLLLNNTMARRHMREAHPEVCFWISRHEYGGQCLSGWRQWPGYDLCSDRGIGPKGCYQHLRVWEIG